MTDEADNVFPRAEVIPRDQLHALLDHLLESAAADGKLQPDAFWTFAAGLAQGRGIGDALHAAGLEAAGTETETRPVLREAQNELRHRAYHIGLLVRLLADIGLLSGPSILPGNFNAGAVVSDLLVMLRGPGGAGEAKPEILTSKRKGQNALRRHARRVLLCAILWRQAHERVPLVSVIERFDLSQDRFNAWLRESGGISGELAQAARNSGEKGDTSNPYWSAPDAELAPLIKLAHKSQGVGERKPLGVRKKKVA